MDSAKALSSSQELNELLTSLSTAQANLGVLVKDEKNPFYKQGYASLKAVIDVYRKPFTEQGLCISQFIVQSQLVSILGHKSGQFIQSMSPIRTKDIDDPQKEGSGITYARRYQLMSITGLAPEDDDGNSASGKGGPAPSLFADAVEKVMQAKAYKHLENLWKKHSGEWRNKLNENEFGYLLRIKDYRKIEFDTFSFNDAMKDAKAFDHKTKDKKTKEVINDVKETFKVGDDKISESATGKT
tara:strand:- start:174 stop:899 length:726 start_codon:yes stop_codon:yes gene_type:complete